MTMLGAPPIPANEDARVAKLREYEILDTLPEQAYDDVTALAAFICQTPIALISLVDADRQWFKANHGLEGKVGSPRAEAFCAHAIVDTRALVIRDATLDDRFHDNPSVTGDPHIRFYAGVPLVAPTGEALGTLCVIDRESRELTASQLDALHALSRQTMSQLELRRTTQLLEQRLLDQGAYVQRLEGYQLQMEQAQAHLQSLTLTDGLTSIGNRLAFEKRLTDEINRAERHGTPLSLLMIDVDRFKALNDRFGHPVGDRTLIMVAKALQEAARTTDFVGRYGGEEFAVLLPHTGGEGALIMAERCRRAVERVAWKDAPVTVSVGAATYVSGKSRNDELVSEADRALYAVKQRGRNRSLHAADLSPAP